MSVEFRIDGLQALINRIAATGADVPQSIGDALDTAMGRTVVPALGVYPPGTGGTYVRTYRLKRGWTQSNRQYSRSGNLVQVKAINPTPYGRYVQGDGRQARVHQGRWQTVGGVLGANRLDAIAIVINRLQEIADGIAG